MKLRHEYSFHLMIKICKNNTFYCITAKQKYLSKILIIYFTVKRSKCNTNIHALISSFLNTEQFNFYFSKKGSCFFLSKLLIKKKQVKCLASAAFQKHVISKATAVIAEIQIV